MRIEERMLMLLWFSRITDWAETPLSIALNLQRASGQLPYLAGTSQRRTAPARLAFGERAGGAVLTF